MIATRWKCSSIWMNSWGKPRWKQVVTFIVRYRLRVRYERNRPHSKTICGKPKEKMHRLRPGCCRIKKMEKEEGRGKGKRKAKNKSRAADTIHRCERESSIFDRMCGCCACFYFNLFCALRPSFTPLRRQNQEEGRNNGKKNVRSAKVRCYE